MDASQAALAATVAAPFVGVVAVLALRHRPNPREAASLVTAVATFLLAILALPPAFAGTPVSVTLATMFGGLTLQLTADGLGLLFASLASFLWILTTVYSVGYMRGLKEHAQTRYYASFALVIGATMGVALSANLFSLFLFYEILTVATYPLVVHKETEEAFKAGRKYLVYTLSGGVAILAGLALLYGIGGVDAIAFVGGGNTGIPTVPADLARAAFLLVMGGFGVKASIVPLHGWLPSAMIAPTPVSGLLHAVAVVKAGVFGLLRLLLFLYGPTLMFTLDLQWVVIAAAVITILVGSLLALVQDDFKLRLAYSTISQLSYIILGAAIVVPIGIGGATSEGMAAAVIGATFAIAAHAFGKLTMFFVAGAVAVETGKTKISQLDGIGRKMPRTFVAFTLATLSMASLPPMAGFVAKWYLSIGAWNAGDWWILFVLVLSSVLNLAYFLPIVIRAFFRPYEGPMGEARPTLGVPLLVTAAGALVLGLWTAMPFGPFELARLIATNVVPAFSPGAFASLISGTAVPPFLIFLIGGPLVLLLKGRARQIGLIILAGIAFLDTVFLPMGETWRLPFMGYDLMLLRVDGLSYLAGLIFAIITFLAVLYAAGFAKPWMHLYALLYAGTSMGAVFAGDWVTLLVFWELMAITSTLLIWENGGEAVGAGYRYLLFHGFGGAMLGAGVALLFFGAPPGTATLLVGSVTGLAALFITIGIGVNMGFIPLHTWLPDSYPKAHFAASVFLSVYTTKAAVYLLARAQPPTELVAFMGGIMAVYGVTFAVLQTNMRKLLSYHIISQVGYMVAGVGLSGWLLSTKPDVAGLGLDGGMAHVFNNILYKPLLFMTIGVIIWKTGENTLTKLGGLQRKMPVTALAYWIAAFSISGVPLFNGYVSKGMVITAAEEANVFLWILLEIASFGTFLSFLKLGYFAFLRPGTTEASDPPKTMQAAMLGTAALCVAIGVYPPLLMNLLPVSGLEYRPFELVRLLETLAVLGAAALFFFTIGRRVLEPHETRLKDADVAYLATGHTITAFASSMFAAFAAIYSAATGVALSFFAAGKRAMRMEDRDVNWNLVAFGGALVVVLGFLLLGVGT